MFTNLKDYLSVSQLHLPKNSATNYIRDLLTEPDHPPIRHVYPDIGTTASIVDDGHPFGLGNPTILRNIFQHLTITDTINLRRVNPTWNFVACEYLKVKLASRKIPPSKMKQFMKLMNKSVENPFSSYAIRIENFKDPLIKKFIMNFSRDIVTFRVKLGGREMPMLGDCLHQLPNLKSFHLIRLPEEMGSLYKYRYKSNKDYWKYGIHQFKNLKSLLFEKEDLSPPFLTDYDSCIIDIINASPNLLTLEFVNWGTELSKLLQRCKLTGNNPKVLDCWKSSVTKEDLIEIFRLDLTFKTLKLSLDTELLDNGIEENFVENWLRKNSTTLQSLEIKVKGYQGQNNKWSYKLPVASRMTKLTSLNLIMWNNPVDLYSLAKHLPVLTTLILSSGTLTEIEYQYTYKENETGVQLEPSNTTVCHSLRILILMFLEKSVGSGALKVLTKIFPNISQLYVQLSEDSSAHVIYKGWSKLKILCLDFHGDYSDEAITGIPVNQYKITKTLECGCFDVTCSQELRNETSISNLKNLGALIIFSGEGLTAISLLDGFRNLKTLQLLWLLPNTDTYRNQWCIKAIADGLENLDVLVTSSLISYTAEEEEYIKRIRPNLQHLFK